MKPLLRLRIGVKVILLLAAFSVFTAGLAGYYTYASSRLLLIEEAQRDQQTAAQVLGRHFLASLDDVARDARMLAREAGRMDETPAVESGDEHLAQTFADLMILNKEYFQVRLIGVDAAATERVRVDRDEQWLVRVNGEQLQEKAHYAYVYETRNLDADVVYFSPISINREMGAHSGQDKPALRVVTPVINRTGERVGLIVINVDLNGLFHLLQADLPQAHDVYLANENGDFLIHPDATQTFAFDAGRRSVIQERFPATAALLGDKPKGSSTGIAEISGDADAVVANFLRLPFGSTEHHRAVILGLAQPSNHVLQTTHEMGWRVVQLVIGFSLLAVALAIFVARTLTRPINQMVLGTRQFSHDNSIVDLPIERLDELGELARGLHDMQHQILGQLNELKEKRLAMSHLARHDALTGLPNRRMFFDLLDHAIANARRSGEQLAIVFVDLDHFKEINDTLGHAAGDIVLKAVAEMLRSTVREVDTVARLGGDEFIILFDRIDDPDHVRIIVEKLHASFQHPVIIEGQSLPVHASIGVSRFPVDGSDSAQLVHNADLAMYRSKRDGRNTFQFHEAEAADDA